jgi:CRISPR-associated protein Cmr5
MSQTLDQQRAAFAWECASVGIKRHDKEYKVLAKGAPALIMNSGLMPTLAFYNHKGAAAAKLLDDLIRGLSLRLAGKELAAGQGGALFPDFMQKLQKESSQNYLRYTDEALELLKWIRQFVDAVGDREPAR